MQVTCCHPQRSDEMSLFQAMPNFLAPSGLPLPAPSNSTPDSSNSIALSAAPSVSSKPACDDAPVMISVPSEDQSCPSPPSHNDFLQHVAKSDDSIEKLSYLKTIKGPGVVSPPPLAKYKKPTPIVPHRPGERYPLGIPYFPY